MAQGASGTYQQSGPSAPQTARAVLAELPSQVKGFGARPASATFQTPGDPNSGLLVQARAAGAGGESITVAFVAGATAAPLSVATTGNAITVTLQTSATGAPESTAAQVRDILNSDAAASALVAAALAGGSNGSSVVTAAAATALAGDVNANVGVLGNAPLPKVHAPNNTYGQVARSRP